MNKPTTKSELRKAQIVNAHARTMNLTDEQYGKLVRAYMTDSIHDTVWEGYPTSDLTGMKHYLEDLALYYENGLSVKV